jgi:hypothetical protein
MLLQILDTKEPTRTCLDKKDWILQSFGEFTGLGWTITEGAVAEEAYVSAKFHAVSINNKTA